MADKRAYFKVDVGYFTNPKVAAVLAESPTAIILHLESIAYAAQHLTDGIVPAALVQRFVGATSDDAELLTDAGLWLPAGKGKVEVHDYLEHQRSAAEAKKLSEAGKRAAASRWQSDSDADGNADRMRNPMPREKEREKREKNTAPAAADADFDTFWAIWPRKEGKAQAAKAWKAAMKKADADTVMAGLRARITVWEREGTAAKFIPLPATWLNGERWADEIATAKPSNMPEGWGSVALLRGDIPEAWR